MSDLLGMLEKAKTLSSQLNAKGVITFGDFNARHQMWGDTTDNSYSKQLVNNLSFQDYTIMSSTEPTFLSDNGNSLIDFVKTSTGSDHLLTDIKTDAEVELYSGAPIRGHVPILTEYRANCGLLLVGGWTKSPADGNKSHSLPGLIYQQEDVGRCKRRPDPIDESPSPGVSKM